MPVINIQQFWRPAGCSRDWQARTTSAVWTPLQISLRLEVKGVANWWEVPLMTILATTAARSSLLLTAASPPPCSPSASPAVTRLFPSLLHIPIPGFSGEEQTWWNLSQHQRRYSWTLGCPELSPQEWLDRRANCLILDVSITVQVGVGEQSKHCSRWHYRFMHPWTWFYCTNAAYKKPSIDKQTVTAALATQRYHKSQLTTGKE